MWLSKLLLVAYLMQISSAYFTLKTLSYTQLPTSIDSKNNNVYADLDKGTATDAAYDYVNSIMYVIGETSHLMHVIDIADPSNPQLLFVHKFTVGEGIPRSIDICQDEIAVSLAAVKDINEGHVRFYKTYTKGSGATGLVIDGYITVGPHPEHLKYTPDCGSIVVANEGSAGKDDAGQYRDPEGTVSIIHSERTGNPSVRTVDFGSYNYQGANYNPDLRSPSKAIPTNVHSPVTTVAEDLEPEYVTISADGRTAWVTLQENNAIAAIDINNGIVTGVYPMPLKMWNTGFIDTSDRDGGNGSNGVHRRQYDGLTSLRQPGVIKSMSIGRKNFLFTADEGAIKSYTSGTQTFTWTEATLGRSIASQIESSMVDLKNNASDDEFLGRLQVSIAGAKTPFTDMYDHLEAFGGRGYSVWDASSMTTPVFDSEGTLEEYMEAFDKSVFNCDYARNTATYQSPEILRDTVSDNMGAKVTGLDIKENNGTVFMVVGTWSTGTLFLYVVDTSSGQPIPQFQSVVRAGVKDLPWRELYANKSAGDLYITDIGIIPAEHSPVDRPLVYVVSTGGGAISMYEIENEHPIISG